MWERLDLDAKQATKARMAERRWNVDDIRVTFSKSLVPLRLRGYVKVLTIVSLVREAPRDQTGTSPEPPIFLSLPRDPGGGKTPNPGNLPDAMLR